MMCEACWNRAYTAALCNQNKSQSEHYRESVNGEYHKRCTPRAQAGQWWDEEAQRDSREE